MMPEAAESMVLFVSVIWLVRLAIQGRPLPAEALPFVALFLAAPAVGLWVQAQEFMAAVEVAKWAVVGAHLGLTSAMIGVTLWVERRERKARNLAQIKESMRPRPASPRERRRIELAVKAETLATVCLNEAAS